MFDVCTPVLHLGLSIIMNKKYFHTYFTYLNLYKYKYIDDIDIDKLEIQLTESKVALVGTCFSSLDYHNKTAQAGRLKQQKLISLLF